jgi:iron complex outermembrane receptor protein
VQAVGRQYVDNSGGTTAEIENDEVVQTERDDRTVAPYALLGGSLTYEPPSRSVLDGVQLQVRADNLLDAHVLRHGFRGVGGPRFYPAATRSLFVEVRYTLR